MRQDGRTATVTREMAYDGYTYRYSLCQDHADDLGSMARLWLMVGEYVDAETIPFKLTGECGRCKKPATQRLHLGYMGEDYLIPLCDAHAEMLSGDMRMWQRWGELVHENLVALVNRLTRVPDGVAAPLGSQVVVPHVTLSEGEQLPAVTDEWHLSVHAQKRLAERGPEFGFTVTDCLLAAVRPEQSGTKNGQPFRVRGRVAVGVAPDEKLITTVMASKERYYEVHPERKKLAGRPRPTAQATQRGA